MSTVSAETLSKNAIRGNLRALFKGFLVHGYAYGYLPKNVVTLMFKLFELKHD